MQARLDLKRPQPVAVSPPSAAETLDALRHGAEELEDRLEGLGVAAE